MFYLSNEEHVDVKYKLINVIKVIIVIIIIILCFVFTELALCVLFHQISDYFFFREQWRTFSTASME